MLASYRRRKVAFYRVVLPILVGANLILGVLLLTSIQAMGWLRGMSLGCGVLCCVIAGWLSGAAWSSSLWSSAMDRQVARWHSVVDAVFGWIEEAPISVDALRGLKRSLDETLLAEAAPPGPGRGRPGTGGGGQTPDLADKAR